MPSRFSWNAFDDKTVAALASALEFDGRGADARAWLANQRPNDAFIKATKSALERYWLPKYAGTKNIVERLLDEGIGPMGRLDETKLVEYIAKCRNTSTVRRLLREALIRFGDADPESPEDADDLAAGFVPRFALLRASDQRADPRRPHDYQRVAWEKLSAELEKAKTSGVFQGLLVMPTGAGKTFTAVNWATREVLNKPLGKVLWIAHRQELLNQAARAFHELVGLAPARKEPLRVRIVSSHHCGTSQVDLADDVLVCSVASLSRHPELVDKLLADEHRMVVVDEAHHAPAKSYRDILEKLLKRPKRKVLGITATPTRTAEQERPLLAKLFGGRVLFEVPIRQLIERGILSRPIAVPVKTRINAEEGVTQEDTEHLARFDDLSEEWLERLAHETSRNAVIVQHLVAHPEYGKTLIFAINVRHAALLTEELNRAGISADYVASYRPDGTDANNSDVLERFRRADGDLRVLVNVQMLTEGVDVPLVQTVFLTRPTVSSILLRQMIGRGLRGPAQGGTKTAYIVSFEDHWEQFPDWQDPLALVEDILPADTEATPATPAPAAQLADALPWEIIRATSAHLRAQGPAHFADAFDAVPSGWYVLAREVDGESVQQVISVYEHQESCWNELFEGLAFRTPEQLTALDLAEVYERFFGDCDVPRTSEFEVRMALEHLRSTGERPEFHGLKARAECEPHAVADLVLAGDLGERKKVALLEERYTPLAQAIYPSMREFRAAVEDALHEKQYPDESTRTVRAVPVFHPLPTEVLRPGPTHNLDALLREVLEVGRKLLGLAETLPRSGTVEWTQRLVKGWYGMAYRVPGAKGTGLIRINRLLDSPDVPAETIRFLLWHEYLHLYLDQLHTKKFRELEQRWPDYANADHVLDGLNERFGIQYW